MFPLPAVLVSICCKAVSTAIQCSSIALVIRQFAGHPRNLFMASARVSRLDSGPASPHTEWALQAHSQDVTWQARESHDSSQSNTESAWSCSSTRAYTFMVHCLIKPGLLPDPLQQKHICQCVPNLCHTCGTRAYSQLAAAHLQLLACS